MHTLLYRSSVEAIETTLDGQPNSEPGSTQGSSSAKVVMAGSWACRNTARGFLHLLPYPSLHLNGLRVEEAFVGLPGLGGGLEFGGGGCHHLHPLLNLIIHPVLPTPCLPCREVPYHWPVLDKQQPFFHAALTQRQPFLLLWCCRCLYSAFVTLRASGTCIPWALSADDCRIQIQHQNVRHTAYMHFSKSCILPVPK